MLPTTCFFNVLSEFTLYNLLNSYNSTKHGHVLDLVLTNSLETFTELLDFEFSSDHYHVASSIIPSARRIIQNMRNEYDYKRRTGIR